MKILLFDIDGTLLNSGGAGYRAMTRAFKALFDIENGLKGVTLSGMTDAVIFKNACEANDVAFQNHKQAEFKKIYLEFLRVEMPKPNPEKFMCPGIDELLPVLADIPDIYLGLLTGNFTEGARIKLDDFGLNKFFEFGAFGDDNSDRNLLYNYAIERFTKKYGLIPHGSQVWIIGDTPRDIACAQPHNAWSVAVATGSFTTEDLAMENPHFLFNDLSDTKAFLQVLDHRA